MEIYNKIVNLRNKEIQVPYELKLIPNGNLNYVGGMGEVLIDISNISINLPNKNVLDKMPESYFRLNGCPLAFEFEIDSSILRHSKKFARSVVKNNLEDLITIMIQDGVIKFISN